MKILFVTHRYPPRAGGVETHVYEIATRLANRGHEVTVFSADAGSDVPSTSTDDGVRVRRFPSVSPNGAFYIAPQMAAAVRRAGADIVHAHNYHAFPLFFAALGVTNERFVVTTHYHGGSANRFRDTLLSLYRPLGRWAVEQADEVIAVSDWERKQLFDDFGADAIVVPNGINLKSFANAEPEQRERRYLLCVGRLEEYKGVQHVIRALPDMSEYELIVAGSGSYQEKLEEITREEGVTDRVDFLGYVDDDRLPKLYTGADVYVTLSEFEAYGMTVAEALAAGTPCLIRERGGLVDWTDNNGVVGITNISMKAIKTGITEATLSDPVSDLLQTWAAVTDKLEVVYRD